MEIPAELTVIIADLKAIQALCENPHWTASRRWAIQGKAIDARVKLEQISKAYTLERAPVEQQLIASWDDGYRQGQEDLKSRLDKRPVEPNIFPDPTSR